MPGDGADNEHRTMKARAARRIAPMSPFARFLSMRSHARFGEHMPATLITAPATEPLSLGEAKAFLRVEHDADDDVITALIAGARIHVEAQTRRALITQTWRIVRDAWPQAGVLAVVPQPLREATAARVYASDNSSQALELDGIAVDAVSGILLLPPDLPAPGRATSGIELDVELGYGDAAADVPEPLRHAIRLLVAIGTKTVRQLRARRHCLLMSRR
jgi:uncharacterized phiE125 gp8 family phage protein